MNFVISGIGDATPNYSLYGRFMSEHWFDAEYHYLVSLLALPLMCYLNDMFMPLAKLCELES